MATGFILSVLLHIALIGIVVWFILHSRVTPKAINQTKITLDLTRIQSLPPLAPSSRPHPKPIPASSLAKPTPKSAYKHHQTAKSLEPKSTKAKFIKQTPNMEENLSKSKSDSKSKKRLAMLAKKRQASTRKKSPTLAKKPKRALKLRQRDTKSSHKPPTKHLSRQSASNKPTGPASRLIKRLYGSSYSRMSSAQRKFIDRNLRRILRISQETLNYLGYPKDAARFGEQGTNIVQFYLHPNGDISGLRLLKRTGSESLDRQSIEVIKTAYMHYPRPTTKTKIIIYVRYRLY